MAAKKAPAKKARTTKALAKKTAAKKATPKKAAAKKAPPKKTAPTKAAPKTPTAKKATPKKVATKAKPAPAEVVAVAPSAATIDAFWALIGEHVTLDNDAMIDVGALQEALEAKSAEEIIAFDRAFDEVNTRACRWDIWGAAYLISGGCSDDGFDYFRGWLIGCGREVFERALLDPDSLVTVAQEDVECEEMLYVAGRAYEAVTGEEIPRGPRGPGAEMGERWDFDDEAEMRRRFPKLAAKFMDGADDGDD